MADPYSRDGFRELVKTEEGADAAGGLLVWYRARENAKDAIPRLENQLAEEKKRIVTITKWIEETEKKLGVTLKENERSDAELIGRTIG